MVLIHSTTPPPFLVCKTLLCTIEFPKQNQHSHNILQPRQGVSKLEPVPCTKFNRLPVFVVLLAHRHNLFIYVSSMAVFMLQLRSWVVVTKISWSTKPKIFMLWLFKKKKSDCWFRSTPIDYSRDIMLIIIRKVWVLKVL